MPILLSHNEAIFEDQTVYLTGHAYIGCTFRRCTLVMRSAGDVILNSCHFEACVWHLDLLISDHHVWDEFGRTVAPLIHQALPRTASDTQASDGGE